MYARTRLPASADSKQSSLPARTSLAQPSSFLTPQYESEPPTEEREKPGEAAKLPKLNPAIDYSFNRIAVSTPRPLVPQFKLTVGQPNDQYEQEADRVAEQVMRMPEPKLPGLRTAILQRSYSPEEQLRQISGSVPPALRVANLYRTAAIQRMCPECEKEVQRQPMAQEEEKKKEEEMLQTKPLAESITPLVQRQTEPMVEEEKKKEDEETLQTKPASGEASTVSPALQNQITALQGGGQPLPQSERHFFEPRFGTDFSQVRIHAGNQAAEAARAVNARAFTLGRDVVFGAGQYQPRSSEGQRLLAHELTHVIQQGQSSRQDQFVQREVHQHRRRSQPHLVTPTLGSCRPVQDDLRPTAPWADLQIGYRARCPSAAADVGGQMRRTVEDILHGRMPRAPHLPDPRSSVDCACAFGTPEQAAWAAMPVLIAAGPLAVSLYRHFLEGSGAPMTIDVADMIARSAGVRRKIRQSIARGGRSGTTRLEQSDYHDRELQFAYGAIDCVQWVALSAPRSWRSDRTTQIRVSMLDYYEFHPGRRGVSQCAHAACVELVARGSAKNFWTRGEAVVTWNQLQAP